MEIVQHGTREEGVAMSGWWSMDNELECGNCGKVGNRYTIVEATRRCGAGLGEWYCVEGEGCQAEKQEDAEMSRRRIEGDAPLFNRGSA